MSEIRIIDGYQVDFTDEQAETLQRAIERDGKGVALRRALLFKQIRGEAVPVDEAKGECA